MAISTFETLPLFSGGSVTWISDSQYRVLTIGLSYQTPVTFLPSLLPNTRNSSYQTPVDNFDYSQPFQQLADRGWAVVEGQSILVVLHPGGVVLEVDHHEIVPEHAFEIGPVTT